jgi:uncharacterized protein YgbK (DUF1537 family)
MASASTASDGPGIVIVADDLSSATDCSVQMIAGGYCAIVPLKPGYAIPATADIIAYDTDSRNLPPKDAAAATRQCIAGLTAASSCVFYKSVDSTLRGNLGAEISALLDGGDFDGAIIAPAFPTYGRTTDGGQQFLNRVPLHETEFATDPTAPVTTSDVADIIAAQCGRKAGLVPLSVLNRGTQAVNRLLQDQLAAGVELFIFDAVEETDLEAIAEVGASLPFRMLWVGSTGLSRYIPKAVGLRPRQERVEPPVAEGSVLIVAGSASETMRCQLDACDLTEVRVNSLPIARGGSDAESEHVRVRMALETADKSRTIALTVTSTRADIEKTKEAGVARGLRPEGVSALVADMLGRLTVGFVRSGAPVKGLVLSGGDTAMTICKQLQVEAIEILDEIEPGIPLGRVIGFNDMLIVTKAGGFGSEQAVVKSVEGIGLYGQD